MWSAGGHWRRPAIKGAAAALREQFVIGASKGIGLETPRQALERGHAVAWLGDRAHDPGTADPAYDFRANSNHKAMTIMKRVILGALAALALSGGRAMAVEEPSFTVVVREGAFEIRDYPALVVAEVVVAGAQKEAASQGFRLLAGYIFGGNTKRQDIAMTAPVAQERSSEKIAMTAPVTQTLDAGDWTVRFTMPSAYSLEALPDPNDPRVQLRTLPPARFAVLQFSGLAQPDDVAAKTAELAAVVQARGLRVLGPPSLAQYNPPWTPWFMRRNEVMFPVAP